MGIISPQNTFEANDLILEPSGNPTNSLQCLEPSYKDYLDAGNVRRLGRIVKMGLTSAIACINDSGISKPDAIISGTALGCIQHTEKFLLEMIENQEKFLTPTSFIQSTANAVASQVALHYNCGGYNFTYSHIGFSFETAILDAIISLRENNYQNILVGGHDEMTEKYYRVCNRIGYWKKEKIVPSDLIHSRSGGSISGEGAAFFLLSCQPDERNFAELVDIKTFYKPDSNLEIEKEIRDFLTKNNLVPEEIDLVIYGINGDNRFDGVYHSLMENLFKAATATWYKHLSGEYQTSSGFALWMGSRVIKSQSIPGSILIRNGNKKAINRILIYNSFLGRDHSVYLISVT